MSQTTDAASADTPAAQFAGWSRTSRTDRGWSIEHLAELAQVDVRELERAEAGMPLRQTA